MIAGAMVPCYDCGEVAKPAPEPVTEAEAVAAAVATAVTANAQDHGPEIVTAQAAQ